MTSFRSVIFQFFVIGQAVFVVGVTVLVYLAGGRLITDYVKSDSEKTLSLLKAQIQGGLLSDLSALDQISRLSFLKNFQASLVSKELKAFLETENPFTSVHVYDVSGRLIQAHKRSTVPDYTPEATVQDVGSEELKARFDSVKYNLEPELTRMIVSDGGFQYQVYLVPVTDQNGYLRHVLMGAISPKVRDLDFLFRGLEIEEGGFLGLYDPKIGAFAGRWEEEHRQLVMELAPVVAQEGFLPPLERERHHIFFDRLPKAHYVLVLGVSKNSISKRQNRLLKYLIPLSSVSLVFAVVLAWVMGRRFLLPTSRLLEALKRIHSGQFSHRTQNDSRDDFGYMCHLVDELAAKLEKEQVLGEFWTDETQIDRLKREDPLR